MNDPSSVQYRNVATYTEGVVCGEYNAKNGFGGYEGFKKFVVKDGLLIREDIASNRVQFCNNEKGKVEVRDVAIPAFSIKLHSPYQSKSYSINVSLAVRKNNVIELEKSISGVVKKISTLLEKKTPTQIEDNILSDNRRAIEVEIKAILNEGDGKGLPGLGIEQVFLLAH